MFLKFASAAVLILAALTSPALAQVPDITGQWARGDGNARVKIASCGDNICATNTWIREPGKGEEVGDRIVMTVKRVSDTQLSGQGFDPKRNLTYSMTITVGAGTLTTQGCVIGGLICKTVNWSRIDS
jgi:uncharacterized protein (DUF2147 family)